jgi:hypothetical protein
VAFHNHHRIQYDIIYMFMRKINLSLLYTKHNVKGTVEFISHDTSILGRLRSLFFAALNNNCLSTVGQHKRLFIKIRRAAHDGTFIQNDCSSSYHGLHTSSCSMASASAHPKTIFSSLLIGTFEMLKSNATDSGATTAVRAAKL